MAARGAGAAPPAGAGHELCCGGPAEGGGGGGGEGEQLDVPLAACCERDLQQQRKGAQMRAALREVDRAMQRQDLRAEAVLSAPSRGPRVGSVNGTDSDESSIEGDEEEEGDDGFLQALRERRMGEIKAAVQATPQRRVGLRAAGGGETWRGYADLEEGSVLKSAKRPGALVVHLAVPGHPACDEADELLAELAEANPGTRFARVALEGSRGSGLAYELCVPGLPAVVSFKRGGVVGSASFDMLGKDGEVHEELLHRHLRQVGIIRHRAMGLESSDDEEVGDEELVAPCPQCGRTYPHVHVRAARAGGVRDWSDGDSGEDDG